MKPDLPDADVSWIQFLRRHSDTATAWADEYDRHKVLRKRNFDALLMSRERRYADAEQRLDEVEQEILDVTEADSTIQLMLLRYVYSVRSYGYYRQGDRKEAIALLDRAQDAIATVIVEHDFLVSHAQSFLEFRTHRAKMARDERRWDDMFAQLEEAREMAQGTRALCELSTGEQVYYSRIDDFYQSLDNLDELETEYVETYTSPQGRMDHFEGVARGVLTFPQIATRYF